MDHPESAEKNSLPGPAQLPAAALRLWGNGDDDDDARGRLEARVGSERGVRVIGPGIFVVLPLAGDPAVFDTALRLGHQAHRQSSALRALVHPIRVRFANGTWEPLPDPLSADLDAGPPELEPGSVHLTGRASQMLERPQELLPVEPYRGPSGRQVAFAKAGPPGRNGRPWRNRELFGRTLPTVHRSKLSALLLELLKEPASALVGPLGSGKTRLAWDHLRRADGLLLWLAAETHRPACYTLAEQTVQRAIALTQQLTGGTPLRDLSAGNGIFGDLEEWRRGFRLQSDEGTVAGALELIDRLVRRAPGSLRIVVDDLAFAQAELAVAIPVDARSILAVAVADRDAHESDGVVGSFVDGEDARGGHARAGMPLDDRQARAGRRSFGRFAGRIS